MNIVFFIFGVDYSGAEIVLDRYLKQNNLINPYFILLYKNDDVEKKYIEMYGKDKVYSLSLKHNKNVLRFLPKIDIKKVCKKSKEIIEFIKPDILYANNTHEMMLCSELGKKMDIKTVAHIHDMKNSIKSPIKQKLMSKSIDSYDKVITVSNATKENWSNEKIEVIYNGIDEKFFKDNDFERNGIKTLGFIGKIGERKGFDIIFNVYRKPDISSQLDFKIAYSSIEERYKTMVDELNSMESVEINYNLNEAEIKAFYDDIDLLVVPSRADPLPTVIIEAMSRGCIVLGSNVDGIPEIIGNDKLLFSLDNNDLEEKIKDIMSMNKEEINNISKELQKRCWNKFNHNKKIKKINDIMKSIVCN